MVGLDSTVVHIANPAIQADLNATFGELQWVINASLLALAVCLIPAGTLGDRYGRKKVHILGVVLFGVTSVAIGLIGGIEGVLVFRALQGVSAALLMPQTIALLRSTLPRETFGMAVGIWGGVSSVSIAGGPLVSGLLMQTLGWEWIFYINVPIAILGVTFLLALFLMNSLGNGTATAGLMMLRMSAFRDPVSTNRCASHLEDRPPQGRCHGHGPDGGRSCDAGAGRREHLVLADGRHVRDRRRQGDPRRRGDLAPRRCDRSGIRRSSLRRIPGVNGAFIDGMHIGLWVFAIICAAVAALVMVAVRESSTTMSRPS
jgi:hypothetical protein